MPGPDHEHRSGPHMFSHWKFIQTASAAYGFFCRSINGFYLTSADPAKWRAMLVFMISLYFKKPSSLKFLDRSFIKPCMKFVLKHVTLLLTSNFEIIASTSYAGSAFAKYNSIFIFGFISREFRIWEL
jgi:hypothetical protein